jgi:putative SOS response-associated peptidase YedK
MFHKFSFDLSREKIKKQFNLSFKQELQKSFHIYALQNAYILTSESNELQIFKWGLIPYWAEDPEKVEHLICAQAEGLASKDSFRMPLRQKRAIVFADSYYNSLRQNKKDQFYRILYKNHSVLAFAAIWDVWISPSGKEYYSFSIITTEADKELSEKGWSRMPLIFTEEEQLSQWLDKEMPLNEVKKMLKTSEIDSLHCYPVSDELLKLTNDYPELHNEI